MGDKTGIEWTDATWNPAVGCSIVSPGCTNCYAMKTAASLERRFGSAKYRGLTKTTKAGAVWTGAVRLDEKALDQPLRWKRPRRIFVNSMSDLFHESLPDEAIDRVFAVMALAPQHTFQVLTKRAERMKEYMLERWQGTPAQTVAGIYVPAGGPTGRRGQVEAACEPFLRQLGLADTTKDDLWTADGKCKAMQWDWPLPNVWLGVSVEDQARAEERIPALLATPAAKRFLSCEPLLGPLTIFDPDGRPLLVDWAIVGGESGPGARPMHPDWTRSLRDQCVEAGVPFFFKQWGEHWPAELTRVGEKGEVWRTSPDGVDQWSIAEFNGGRVTDPISVVFERLGKKRAGRLLDGREWNEMPR